MPTRTVGRYRLTRQLGVGMFSKVMVGVDEHTNLEYAVKVMRKDSLEEMDMARYARREAAILRKLSHPNIVKFIEAIQSETKLFLIMEIVPGCELLDIVSNGPLSEHDAKIYLSQLIDAISYLHTKGIVHRDLKPDNVLVDVDTKTLKIIDFGLTGVIRKNVVMKTCCGSNYYSAPEVTFSTHQPPPPPPSTDHTHHHKYGYANASAAHGHGGYDGIKADSWSLGILAYILLTGSHPFVDNDGELMVVMMKQGIVEYPDFLSSNAVHFISRLLAIDPRKRYSVAQVSLHPWLLTKLSATIGLNDSGDPQQSYTERLLDRDRNPNQNHKNQMNSVHIGNNNGNNGTTNASIIADEDTNTSNNNHNNGNKKKKNGTFTSTTSSTSSNSPSHSSHQQQQQQQHTHHHRNFFGRTQSGRSNHSSVNLTVRRRSSQKNSSSSFLWFRRPHSSTASHNINSNSNSHANSNGNNNGSEIVDMEHGHLEDRVMNDDMNNGNGSNDAVMSMDRPSTRVNNRHHHRISNFSLHHQQPQETAKASKRMGGGTPNNNNTNNNNNNGNGGLRVVRRGSLDRSRPGNRDGRITLDFMNVNGGRAHHESLDVGPRDRVRRQLSLSTRTRALLMRGSSNQNNGSGSNANGNVSPNNSTNTGGVSRSASQVGNGNGNQMSVNSISIGI